MATSHSLKAETRACGSGNLKQLRSQGLVPGVVYGPGFDNVNIQVDAREFARMLASAVSEHILVALDINGKIVKVLLKEVQHNPITNACLHVDFQAVTDTTVIHSIVPVILEGDSIAGGGGLISLPVLLAAGLPPHLAIGTNKFSATFGAVMSAWQFWRAGKVDMSLLKRVLPGTFIGAILGCLVMLHLRSEWLQPIIIIALIAAAVFVFTQRQLGAVSTYRGNTRRNVLAALAMALGIGFYDGFIGPGTGTFLIVGFAALGFDFVTAAGNAKILNLMSNMTAFVLLVWWGQILYVYGIAMALCIFIGAFFGSRMAIRRGTGFVRLVMLAVTVILIGKLGLSYFGMM